MEIFWIIILIIVVVILLVQRTKTGTNKDAALYTLINEVAALRKEITHLKAKVEVGNSYLAEKIDILQYRGGYTPEPVREQFVPEEPLVKPVVAEAHESTIDVPVPEDREEVKIVNEEQYQDELNIEPEPSTTLSVMEEVKPVFGAESAAAFTEQQAPSPKYVEQESTMDKWMRNNPDLEKFIGENLINKIGIAILVLGIAFFVKYAIDKDWINETGRVCIGLGCGALLVGLAHYMRNSYRSFSSVLAGGGIAVFYFTIAFSFHQYHLMSQTAAFIVMVIITAFAVALSVLYDKLELAIIATIGGFITPFLLSTGEGNYIVLFTYLIILDAGILLLAYFKRWPSINIIALIFTEIIYGGWLVTTVNNPSKPVSYPTALLFASAFYFIFLAMNMVNQMRNKAQFKPFDFIILLLISSSFFAAGITLLHSWNNGAYQGLFTLGLSFVNLGLAYYVFKSGRADKNLLFLLIGITLTFITLTIPIQLHGHAITLFWSAEFVLLYWLAGYSGIRLFKYSSLLISMLTLVSLFMDWERASGLAQGGLHVIFNNAQGIITNLVATAAFALWWYLLRRNKEEEIGGVPNTTISRVAITVATALLFITCIFSVNLYFRSYTFSYAIPNVYHRTITNIFALVFVLLIRKRKEQILSWLPFAALCICLLVLMISIPEVNELRGMVLASKANWVHFIMHWVDGLVLGILFYKTIQSLRNLHADNAEAVRAVSVIVTVMSLVFLSTELRHVYVMIGYNGNNAELLEYQYGKAGLTILWGLSSFALMWLGMKHQNKTLRIISLVLFSVVLLKLFIVDISGISEGGKILAFILLGVLLLTVSFMYQKLKKIIIDDKKTEI